MKRKVIKLGKNSLLVSLPSKWVRMRGLMKGDEVNMHTTPHQITITTSKTAQISKNLILGNNPEFAARQINIAYKKGFDELEIQYENPKSYAAVVKELQALIGFEVVESGKHYSKIKNIATGEVGDLQTVLRRVFLNLLELAETVEQHTNNRTEESLEHVKVAEQNIDRLTDFCKRLLNKQGMADVASTTQMYGVLKDIERIADQYFELAKTKIPPNFVNTLKEIRSQLRILYELFYAFDPKKAEQCLEKTNQIDQTIKKLMKNKPLVSHHLASIVKLMDEMSWSVYSKAF